MTGKNKIITVCTEGRERVGEWGRDVYRGMECIVQKIKGCMKDWKIYCQVKYMWIHGDVIC